MIPAFYDILHVWSWGKIYWRNKDILQYTDFNFLQELILVYLVVYKHDRMIYSFVFAIFQAGMEQYQEYFNFYIQLVCFLSPYVVYIGAYNAGLWWAVDWWLRELAFPAASRDVISF